MKNHKIGKFPGCASHGMVPVKPASYKLDSNPFIVQILDISTGHLSKKDRNLLKNSANGDPENPIVCYAFTYGYYVFIHEREDILRRTRDYGYSKQFMDILNKARALNCKYVKYDCDGIEYDDLKTYD